MEWKNPLKRRGRFVNPHIEDLKRDFNHVIRWRLGHYADQSTLAAHLPAEFSYPAKVPAFDLQLPWAMWLGHSTYLIQVDQFTILTDPIFSDYCSPVPIRMLKRHHRVPMEVEELPRIDLILISHNHYDHLDAKSVRRLHRLYPDAMWVVPQGVGKWFVKRGIQQVIELNWGDEVAPSGACQITAVPAQHFSGRSLWDKNRTLWCGYVVRLGSKTFYFAGDTGYNPIDFKQIGSHFPSIDLSLIPIGTYLPKAFMQPVHISPTEAVQIHCDVGSRLSLGMHWKTFRLSEEPLLQPPYDLFLAMQEKGLAPETFLPLEPGQRVNW